MWTGFRQAGTAAMTHKKKQGEKRAKEGVSHDGGKKTALTSL